MNILLIISSNEGTIASCAYQLYRGLLKEAPEHKIYVICYGKYSKDGFNFGHGTCFKLNFLKKHGVSSIGIHTILLKRIKKKYKIDCSISTQTGTSLWNVISGIGEYKIGIFHAKLEQARAAGLKNYLCFWLLYKTLFKFLDKKIGVSKSVVEDLITNIGGNIQLCYNIHDIENIRQKAQKSLLDKDEIEIFSKPVILYVGAAYEYIKAPDRLLKAFISLNKQIADDIQLVYIGKDIDCTWEKLKELAHKNHVDNSVHFLGPRKNPYQYMQRASMLVSPSRDEGLPGVIIESLSIGIPCVATNSTLGNWEIMQCDHLYKEKLTDIIYTSMGCITPNIINDEEFTVKMLAKGIYDIYINNDLDLSKFDTSRFTSNLIISRMLADVN